MVTLLVLSMVGLVPIRICGPQWGIGDHPTDHPEGTRLSVGTPMGRIKLGLVLVDGARIDSA